MRRLSSKATLFHKKIFPAIWLGGVAIFGLVWTVAVFMGAAPIITILIAPVMFAFGYILSSMLLFPLADEVYLVDDQIIVRNRGEEQRIPLHGIRRVEATLCTNPERITLYLFKPCAFGNPVEFSPPLRMWRFYSKHPLAYELEDRVSEAAKRHTVEAH